MMRAEVDVDSWIDRHVGWHFVLMLIGAAGGCAYGYMLGKENPSVTVTEIRSNTDSYEKTIQGWRKLYKESEADAKKLRSAVASCDKRAAEWERRAREKGE